MPESSLKHAEEAPYWFPVQASEFAPSVDNLYMAIFWVSTLFFAVIVGLMFYFVVKYRRQPGVKPQPSASHNTAIEILWSVLPSIILVWFFYDGARGYFEMRTIPDTAEEIRVRAYQFGWQFTYPDGDISNELHVVQNRPVKLIMESSDVLHSFYIAAFRQKMDIVPGRYSYLLLQPNLVGEYRLSCTEYCGDNHSRMRTVCVVHVDEEDRKKNTEWKKAEHAPWINGQRLYKIHCAGCHNINGMAGTGPALNLIWGAEEEMIDGTRVKVDENYVRESILQPDAKIVAGYGPVSKMQSFQGKLSDDDINHLISFIQLKDEMQNPPADTGTAAAGAESESPAAGADTAPAAEGGNDGAAEPAATGDQNP